MTIYTISEQHEADGVAWIRHPYYGKQLWCRSNKNTIKDHECVMCGRVVKKNTERMYRTLKDGFNRMHRICCTCIEKKE